uniref:Ovule protein n=1 Tax=Rodentolepis nana TaxID=102285 RepID=A0A0R3TDU0_RODNA
LKIFFRGIHEFIDQLSPLLWIIFQVPPVLITNKSRHIDIFQ